MNETLYKYWANFLTKFGDIYISNELPQTKAKQILGMLEIVQSGDVLARRYKHYLDGKFIPGKYSHSGLVLNKNAMAHAIAEGVEGIHPIDFIKDTDGFIILRPPYKSEEHKKLAFEKALWHLENKTQYDFLFNDPKRVYCHEFTASCLLAAGIDVQITTKKFGTWPFSFEKDIYLAQNLIDCCNTVYEFDPN